MQSIELWNLMTDIALVLSLMYLCYRFVRNTGVTSAINTRQVLELESALRTLIKEADSASKLFGQELSKRQDALEKLLFDIETVEHRLNRTMDSADEHKRQIELELSKAQKLSAEIASDNRLARNTQMQPTRTEIVVPEEAPTVVHEPPSFQPNLEKTAAEHEPQWGNVNIYGDPIGQTETPSQLESQIETETNTIENSYSNSHGAESARSGIVETDPTQQSGKLAAEIEKEIHSNYTSNNELDSVQDVYAAAEEMLRAGEAAELVAAATKLPPEEVSMLARMVAQEKVVRRELANSTTELEDPRLGVLGTIKRQRMVL